eukprot:5018094-Amphidinium_carterae.1
MDWRRRDGVKYNKTALQSSVQVSEDRCPGPKMTQADRTVSCSDAQRERIVKLMGGTLVRGES